MTSLEISRLHAELTKISSNPAMPADMLEQGSAFKVLLESNYDVAATGRRPPETKPRASQKHLCAFHVATLVGTLGPCSQAGSKRA